MLPQVDIGKGQLPLLEGKMCLLVDFPERINFFGPCMDFHGLVVPRDDCEIDYNDEDIAKNDFNKVMNELEGQHDGFPINASFFLILVSVLGFALIAITIFFCIKIFSGNHVIEDDEEAAIESNPESKERDDALSISNMETIIHILKGNIGIGVLTLPMALRNSGLIFGSLGLIFIAYLCVYCMMLLVNAAHRVRTRTECVPSTYCVK